MLKSEHSIVRYDFDRHAVFPDRLIRGRDDSFLPAMEECLRVYRDGESRKRQSLHEEVESILLKLTLSSPRRIAAFCKLLDDASVYLKPTESAWQLRRRVFTHAAGLHPIVTRREGMFEHDIHSARDSVCNELGMSWEDISDALFADVIELQKLQSFDNHLTASELLSRYNVAQTQACLYRATRVRIDAFQQAPFILRQAKLAGLMHRVQLRDKPSSHYRIVLDGPVAALRETTRYGIKYAHLLAGLLRCDDWRLLAEVIGPQNRKFALRLSSTDGLRSQASGPPLYDSKLEETVQQLWEQKPLEGWSLARDTEFIVRGQSIYTPDFLLQQSSVSRKPAGAKIYIEVVGYWTPEYLQEKKERLERFVDHEDQNVHWLLMFEKPPSQPKYEQLLSLGLPMVVLSKHKKPAQWIQMLGK